MASRMYLILLALVLCLCCQSSTALAGHGSTDTSSPKEKTQELKDGIYTGSAIGYVDRIVVEVTVSEGKITQLKIIEDAEDIEYMDMALSLLEDVIDKQSTDVDTVGGATSSSKGILKAVAQALEKASEQASPEIQNETLSADVVVHTLAKLKILFSLLVCLVIAVILNTPIKRHPWVFYAGALLVALLSLFYYPLKWSSLFPDWCDKLVLDSMLRGTFPTALFICVMYAGALPIQNRITQKLMRIRTEFSIAACIITLSHNITYGKVYFKAMMTGFKGVPIQYGIATLITLLLLTIMIPLFITSFPSVRRTMTPRRWKKLQRWAYVFYGGIYCHVAVMYIFDLKKRALELALYTILFGTYGCLRITKAFKEQKNRSI